MMAPNGHPAPAVQPAISFAMLAELQRVMTQGAGADPSHSQAPAQPAFNPYEMFAQPGAILGLAHVLRAWTLSSRFRFGGLSMYLHTHTPISAAPKLITSHMWQGLWTPSSSSSRVQGCCR